MSENILLAIPDTVIKVFRIFSELQSIRTLQSLSEKCGFECQIKDPRTTLCRSWFFINASLVAKALGKNAFSSRMDVSNVIVVTWKHVLFGKLYILLVFCAEVLGRVPEEDFVNTPYLLDVKCMELLEEPFDLVTRVNWQKIARHSWNLSSSKENTTYLIPIKRSVNSAPFRLRAIMLFGQLRF